MEGWNAPRLRRRTCTRGAENARCTSASLGTGVKDLSIQPTMGVIAKPVPVTRSSRRPEDIDGRRRGGQSPSYASRRAVLDRQTRGDPSCRPGARPAHYVDGERGRAYSRTRGVRRRRARRGGQARRSAFRRTRERGPTLERRVPREGARAAWPWTVRPCRSRPRGTTAGHNRHERDRDAKGTVEAGEGAGAKRIS